MPFGKYEYQRLPMGLSNSPDIFQEKMSELMTDLEFVRVYIDDLLCLTAGTLQEHLENLDLVLSRLKRAGLKVNGVCLLYFKTVCGLNSKCTMLENTMLFDCGK